MLNSIDIILTDDDELNKIILLLETTTSLIPDSIINRIQANGIEEDFYQIIYVSALECKQRGLSYMKNSLDILNAFQKELNQFYKDYNLLS